MIQYARICDSLSTRLLISAVSGGGVSIYSNLDSTYPATRLCDCMLGIRCQDRSLPSFGQNNGGWTLLDSGPRFKLEFHSFRYQGREPQLCASDSKNSRDGLGSEYFWTLS